MSWSIENDDSDSDLQDLLGALNRAHSVGILMFCSCIDRGASRKDDSYPGTSGYAIKIGAANSSGEKLQWVSTSQSDYLLPGENVQPQEPTADAWSGYRSGPFGSSIATALAAGLAGVLLYYDRLIECPDRFTTLSGDKVDYLRGVNNMKTVLDNMKGKSSQFIEVGNNLERYFPTPQDIIWNRKKDKGAKTKEELESFMWAMKGKPVRRWAPG